MSGGGPLRDVEALRRALAIYAPSTLPKAEELAQHRPAAVLVPVVVRAGAEPSLLFMERPQDGSPHGGQVSFPGGKVEADDAGIEAAALREAEEELGVPRHAVELWGRLGELATPTGYLITPVVGLVREPPAAWRPNPAEVHEAFEVPVARLRDPALFEDRGEIQRWGLSFRSCAYRPDGRFIWGATARILHELLELWR